MSEQEEQLTGGNTAESVVRLGSTVRKPVTPSTPAVHSLLAYLKAVGCEASPAPLGIDEQGRQVLEFVHGQVWNSVGPHTQIDFRRIGTIIRTLHDTAASFQMPEEAQWNVRYEPDERDLICHNDLAPWNLICGDGLWVFIDWDAAAPATRLWDLAWASISFPPFEPQCDLPRAATSMHALLNGYCLQRSSYGKLIKLMVTRARAEHDFIVEGAQKGQEPWAKLYAEEHHRYWGPVSEYIHQNASALEELLESLDHSTHRSS